LRVMARRCFEFIDRHGWDLGLEEVVEWHAEEFGELFPELQDNVEDVKDIVRHEEEKYEEMKEEAERELEGVESVGAEQLVELYDSKGITPEMLERRGIDVEVPSNFYQVVAERHEGEGVEEEEDRELIVGIAEEITERRRVQERNQRLLEILEATPEYIGTAEPDGRVIYLNQTFCERFGIDSDEDFSAHTIGDFHPEDEHEHVMNEVIPEARENGLWQGETTLKTPDGELIPVSQILIAHYDSDQDVDYYSTMMRDITDIKRTQKKLEKSLEEKEMLLSEVHHRVKNNLQLITSLLRMQLRQLDDDQSPDALLESKDRIQSIALLHETLYQSSDLARADFPRYMRRLVQNLKNSHQQRRSNVRVDLNVQVDSLELEKAIPSGLICNEAVSNAFEHAFGGRDGVIEIEMTRSGGSISLMIKDNGVGLGNGNGSNPEKSDSFGLKLIRELACNQLNGTFSVSGSSGTEIHVEFPLE
ncbi:MAG: sensor histidine kinase, partial [bacterium]